MLVRCEQPCRYRGEDQTLGPGVRHLDLLQGSEHGLHLGRVASLRDEGEKEKDNDDGGGVASGSAAPIPPLWPTFTGMSWSWLDDWAVNT